MNKENLKEFGLWVYKNVFVKYLQFRYRTTLLTLARLTLVVLAKEVVVPFLYWLCVVYNAIWPNTCLNGVLEAIQVACVPSTTEIIIAILAVVVLLIVAFFEYRDEKRKVDLLTDVYIPYTDGIFSYLDVESYHDWTYHLALNGNTILGDHQYDDLEELIKYLKSRLGHEQYEQIDKLYHNLSNVVTDILFIFAKYGEVQANRITIRKFYKDLSFNPNYQKDLEWYNAIVMLISDLVFEQTRICNLILKKIREVHPDYLVHVGVLMVDSDQSHNIYTVEEEDIVEYSGLMNFMVERETRSYHMGSGSFDI